MKRLLFCLFWILLIARANSTIITWTGTAGDGKWSTAGNWSPATVPTSIDDVVFTAVTVTVQMDIIPAISPFIYAINSLKITGNANVELVRTQVGGGFRILQVRSTNTTTKGLQINAGSILLIHGINTSTGGILQYILDFGGAAGVTGEVFGELQFSGIGSGGTTDATRLRVYTDASNNGSLVVKSGGVIKYVDLTGNTTSNSGSYLTMENGSTYLIEKNGGSFPDGAWQPTSLAKVNNLFGPNGPAFNGTSYGNLEWDCSSQTVLAFLNASVSFNNVDFINTNGERFTVKTGTSVGNYTMTINGNLDIRSGSFVDIVNGNPTGPSSGKIVLKGNLKIWSGGVLSTNGGPMTTNQFELNGSSNQNITVDGFLLGVKLEFIMNGVSATLITPVTLPGDNNATGVNLQLVNGKIKTTGSAKLIMIDNSSTSNGSTNSFVEGPMVKRGANDFVFPVGIGGIYAPIGMYSGTGQASTDAFTAEYKRANPQSTYGPNVQSGMEHVSYVEYWTLSRNNGTASKLISLDVHLLSFCKVLASTYVSQWNGTFWTQEPTAIVGGTTTIGLYQVGTIKTNSAISNFASPDTAFTLITNLDETANPLPVTLISFDAHKLSTTKSSADWELASVCSPAAKFEVQRAETNSGFVTIGTLPGNANSKSYNFIDNDLKTGINYYRLKITGEDGKISYSRTVAVMNGVNTVLLTSMIPTVVNQSASLTVSSSTREKITIMITDMQGRVVQQNSYNIDNGNSTIEIGFDRLAAGVYQLTGITSSGRLNTIRFIKN